MARSCSQQYFACTLPIIRGWSTLFSKKMLFQRTNSESRGHASGIPQMTKLWRAAPTPAHGTQGDCRMFQCRISLHPWERTWSLWKAKKIQAKAWMENNSRGHLTRQVGRHPIVLTSVTYLTNKQIRSLIRGKFQFQNKRNRRRVVTKEVPDFSAMNSFFHSLKLCYFIFLQSQKHMKAVIKTSSLQHTCWGNLQGSGGTWFQLNQPQADVLYP
jgi:hypothetical protein